MKKNILLLTSLLCLGLSCVSTQAVSIYQGDEVYNADRQALMNQSVFWKSSFDSGTNFGLLSILTGNSGLTFNSTYTPIASPFGVVGLSLRSMTGGVFGVVSSKSGYLTTDTQGGSPKPLIYYTTGAHGYNYLSYNDESDGSLQTRNAMLFSFSTGTVGFGAWFSDLETRNDGSGTAAAIKLYDANMILITGSVIYTTTPLVDQARCALNASGVKDYNQNNCGNTATRYIGFSAQQSEHVAYMLVVVGDDDATGNGNNEGMSFIGGYVAQSSYDLSISATGVQSVHYGDPSQKTYTIPVSNLGIHTGYNINMTVAYLGSAGYTLQDAQDPSIGSLNRIGITISSGSIYETFSLGDIAPGETKNFGVLGVFTGNVGHYPFTFSLANNIYDTNTGNDATTIYTDIVAPESRIVMGFVAPGVIYTTEPTSLIFQITNNGPSELDSGYIDIALPAGFVLTSFGDDSDGTGMMVSQTATSIRYLMRNLAVNKKSTRALTLSGYFSAPGIYSMSGVFDTGGQTSLIGVGPYTAVIDGIVVITRRVPVVNPTYASSTPIYIPTSTPTITGSATSGSLVTITINGMIYTGLANGSGLYSITIMPPLANTGYTIVTTIEEYPLGGLVTTFTGYIMIDTLAPVLPAGSGAIVTNTDGSGHIQSGTPLVFSGNLGAGESGSIVTIVIGTSTYTGIVGSNGSYSITIPTNTLSVGIHTATLSITDRAGNASSSQIFKFYIDLLPVPFTPIATARAEYEFAGGGGYAVSTQLAAPSRFLNTGKTTKKIVSKKTKQKKKILSKAGTNNPILSSLGSTYTDGWFVLPRLIPATGKGKTVFIDTYPRIYTGDVTQTGLTYWLDRLPYKKDKSASMYIVLPVQGIVSPIVSLDPTSSDYQTVYSGGTIDFNAYLRDGVMQYPGSSQPNITGNMIVLGHSSYFTKDTGRYKTVFQKLTVTSVDQEVRIYVKNATGNYDRTMYIVKNTFDADPTNTSMFAKTARKTITLITCIPFGTAKKRRIVQAVAK